MPYHLLSWFLLVCIGFSPTILFGLEETPEIKAFAIKANSLRDDEKIPVKERISKILALAEKQNHSVKACAYLYCLDLATKAQLNTETIELFAAVEKLPDDEYTTIIKKLVKDTKQRLQDGDQQCKSAVSSIVADKNSYKQAYRLLRTCADFTVDDLTKMLAAITALPLRYKIAVAVIEKHHLSRKTSYQKLSPLAIVAIGKEKLPTNNWCVEFLQAVMSNNEKEIIALRNKIWRLPNDNDIRSKISAMNEGGLKYLERGELPLFPLMSASEYEQEANEKTQKIRERLIAMIIPADDLFTRAQEFLYQTSDKFVINNKECSGADIARGMTVKRLVIKNTPKTKSNLPQEIYEACQPADTIVAIRDYSSKERAQETFRKGERKDNLTAWLFRQLAFSDEEYEQLKLIGAEKKFNPANLTEQIDKNNMVIEARRQTLKNTPLSELITRATLALFDDHFTAEEIAEIKTLSKHFSPEFVLGDLPTFMLRYYINENLTPAVSSSNPNAATKPTDEIINRAIENVEKSKNTYLADIAVSRSDAETIYSPQEVAAQMKIKRLILAQSKEFAADEKKILELISQTSNNYGLITQYWVIDENGKKITGLWYWLLQQLGIPNPLEEKKQ